MPINSDRRARIIRFAAFVLLALFLTQQWEARWTAATVTADGLPVEQFSMSYGKVSLSSGQTMRINLTHFAADMTEPNQPIPAIRACAQFRDTLGNTIHISTQGGGVWKTVNAGQSCSFEVNRDELTLTGDPRTGAVALVPELSIEVLRIGVRPDFPTSLEITDNVTGKVVFHSGKSVTRSQPRTSGAVVFVGGWGCSLFSVARGETLQVNITNPLPLTLANQPVAGTDYIITLKGVAGEASAVRAGVIRPGQTIVVRFNRDRLPAAGDYPAGSVRFIIDNTYGFHLSTDQLAALGGELPVLPVTLELEDGGTQTTRLDSYYGTGFYRSMDSGRSW